MIGTERLYLSCIIRQKLCKLMFGYIDESNKTRIWRRVEKYPLWEIASLYAVKLLKNLALVSFFILSWHLIKSKKNRRTKTTEKGWKMKK